MNDNVNNNKKKLSLKINLINNYNKNNNCFPPEKDFYSFENILSEIKTKRSNKKMKLNSFRGGDIFKENNLRSEKIKRNKKCFKENIVNFIII